MHTVTTGHFRLSTAGVTFLGCEPADPDKHKAVTMTRQTRSYQSSVNSNFMSAPQLYPADYGQQAALLL